MPLTKVDYSKTIIYKIQHQDNDELLYVGSTTDFTRRKSQHKRVYNNANSRHYNTKIYKMIRDNGGFDCFNMTIIKEFPCSNKQEALTEEDRLIREMKTNMNTRRAFTTPEEKIEKQKIYKELHKEEILEYQKQHYELNKEKIAERHKHYNEQNKEKIAEQQKHYNEQNKEKISEYMKQYYELNKEKIAEYTKQHYELNKEKRAEQNKQHYELNKQKIAERRSEQHKQKMTCECGCVVTRGCLARHRHTKKHQDLLNMTEQ